MRIIPRYLALSLVLVSWGVSTQAAEAPIAVSPGAARGTTIVDPCPTFSWGPLDGARAYELLVYRVEGAVPGEKPALSQTIPGGALGWTPDLDQCLDRGTPFAWSVRGIREDGPSEWSDLRFFEVVATPSKKEVAAALDVLYRYLDEGGEPSTVDPATHSTPRSLPGRSPADPAAPVTAMGVADLTVEGEVRTVDPGGEPRIWGRGRPGAELYGLGLIFCTNWPLRFGLSKGTVDWGSAADACPAGTWVCAQDDLVPCDTLRPDTSIDAWDCDGTPRNFDEDNHYGWVADFGGSAARAFTERGTIYIGVSCEILPAWCCWE